MDKDKKLKEEEQAPKEQTSQRHSSAFNEKSVEDEKSTFNVEEESDLEQKHKEAMTERD